LRVLALACASVAAALALAADASACSCAPVDLVRDLPRSDGAFVGSVLEHRREGSTAIYLFRVEQVYKGDIENRVEVVTPADSAACALELGLGQRAGLLLLRDGGEWRSSLCSQVDPSEFLALTDVPDNSVPPVNWGGIVVGVLVLGAGGFFLLRKLRQYKGLR
jgi:hypothetical protein